MASFDSLYIISSEQFHKETVYDEVNGRGRVYCVLGVCPSVRPSYACVQAQNWS